MLPSGTSTRLRIAVDRMLPGERERETACVVRLGSVWATDGIAFGSTRSCSGSGSTTVSVLCNNRLQGREVQSSACTEMSAVLNPLSCSTYLTWDTE